MQIIVFHPDLTNQELLRMGPTICSLTSSLGDSAPEEVSKLLL